VEEVDNEEELQMEEEEEEEEQEIDKVLTSRVFKI
jgi:hypothetical protein